MKQKEEQIGVTRSIKNAVETYVLSIVLTEDDMSLRING